jgi:hypothetical protein
VRVRLAAHVLEVHPPDFEGQEERLRMKRLQPGMFHLVVAEHLLHEQLRIRADRQGADVVGARPFERRQQSPVFGDVIGCDADRVAEFLDEPSDASIRTP